MRRVGALTNAAVDPHWIFAGGPALGSPKVSADSAGYFPALPANAPSTWVAPGTLTSPSGSTAYGYRTGFWIDPGLENTTLISGRWSAAMTGVDILLNVSHTFQLASNSSAFVPFIVDHGFNPGPNNLLFVVSNQSSAYTGLRVEMSGSSIVFPTNFVGDTDGDGLADTFEMAHFGGLTQIASSDFDGDGVSNGDEIAEGTDPANKASFRPRLNITSWMGQVLRNPETPSFRAAPTSL